MGKSYAPGERHPHAWGVGWEMYREAGADPRLQAGALGYLCHLAADVGAHESFVPRMMMLTASSRGVGHSYWEHRMDLAVGPDHIRTAGTLLRSPSHRPVDALLDRVLDRTLFLSFGANRRIFQGMVQLVDDRRWHSLFDALVDVSRWDLPGEEVERYVRNSFDLTAGLLREWEGSAAAAGDPTGGTAVERAKRARRAVLRREGLSADPALRHAADHLFPLPTTGGELWERRGGTHREADAAVRLLASTALRRKAG